MTHRRLLWYAALAALSVPAVVLAQGTPPLRVRREIPGTDFRKDGVWRRQARAVHANRARLLARRNFAALNAPLAASGGVPLSSGAPLASAAAVSGVLRVPAVLFKFQDTPTRPFQLVDRSVAAYNQVLFATTPPAGRPYTYRTYYEQLSNGLLSVQGTTYGYVTLDSNEITYVGTPPCSGSPYPGSTQCNGFFTNTQPLDPFTRMQDGLREALAKIDYQVDWTQYDADGDGYVDLVAFIQPALDGACGGATNNHIWSHRGTLNPPYYSTHSRSSQGIRLTVVDYIVESGVGGGADGCDSTQIMPIGTVAHETGHGFGLPDLYDTDFMSEGIGEYSLMGSGNFTSPASPSRMDAWSLHQLGWVTVVPLPTAGTYDFGAAPTADTAFYVPLPGSNPRGEYFLLENRQAVQSDSAMLHYHCEVWYANPNPPGSCGGGLIIYHVDGLQISLHGLYQDNRVNTGSIHGLELVQADGLGNLDVNPNSACYPGAPRAGCSDRGDAGDLYPGTTGNVALTPSSVPAALRNVDTMPAGIQIDQIVQLIPNGAMRFRLTFPLWVVRALVDTAALVRFDGVSYHVFRGSLRSGSVHTVAVDNVQLTNNGRTQQVFVSWSDGQPISHSYTAGAAPETLTATLARSHQLVYSATIGGTITAPVTSGSFIADGSPVTLIATDTSTSGRVFLGWSGDTITKNTQITLPMTRPYTVRAVFMAPLNTADVVAQLLNGTGPLTAQQLQDLDQLGNGNGRFDVGDFLAWVQATGAPLTAPQRALVRGLKLTGALR